jgi:hypothetical protein
MSSAEKMFTVLKSGFLKPIAFRQFEDDRGTAVREVLPGNVEQYDFESSNFSGWIDPQKRSLNNLTYDGHAISVSNIMSNPELFESVGFDLVKEWKNTFGQVRHMSKQVGHPGEPPMTAENMKQSFVSLGKEYEVLCANPMLQDLIDAMKDKNYRVAIEFLNEGNAAQALDSTVGHELSELFLNGDVNVLYKNTTIAVLKPEYNNEIENRITASRIINRRGGTQIGTVQIRNDGEQPEEAFVVGVDDTPTGLFAHAIDGTRLDHDQDVSREYIHDVMGFDVNYNHEDVLRPSVGERIRLQGDLAVHYIGSQTSETNESGQCPIPIDNHYVALTQGQLAAGETKDQEPIRVEVPSNTHLNIAHDEHDNVTTELEKGTYEFYLLQRGLQPESERPDWPEPVDTSV